MREWSVGRAAFAPVVSLGYLGMMIGGTLAGLAGDRFGRRNALLGCMVLFGATTIVVAGVPDVVDAGRPAAAGRHRSRRRDAQRRGARG